jgi:hypothetical protein
VSRVALPPAPVPLPQAPLFSPVSPLDSPAPIAVGVACSARASVPTGVKGGGAGDDGDTPRRGRVVRRVGSRTIATFRVSGS